MKIKSLTTLAIIILIASCGKTQRQSPDVALSTYDTQANILGLWKVKCDTNMVLRDSDTILITSLNQKIHLALQHNKEIAFDGVVFSDNKLNYHILKNDTIRYYDYRLSDDHKAFIGGTNEGWDGRTQEITLIKLE